MAYTDGEAIGPEIFKFYRSLGLNLKQLYGQTEASVYITAQPDGEISADTVGTPSPDVEIEIADSGEVMYRSPGVFTGYYKNDEATRETKTEEGWVYTGDAGFLDSNGHLRIIDRAKDVGKLNNGSMFPPKYIENKLKFLPNIKEAVAIGDGRDDGIAVGEELLSVSNVTLRFGGVTAISDISFDILKGEIRAIIGPNGAGKTSMLNVINGFYHPQEGSIKFRGEARSRMRPYEAAASGIARTF